MEHIGDGRQRLHADPALMERVAHLPERDPGFALRNLSQCLRMWLEDRPTIATNLRRSCASRLTNTLQKLDRGHALTSKRCAADRAEVPAATHRTIRPRRSWDNGVVIVSSIAPNRPDSYKSHTPDSVQTRTALADPVAIAAARAVAPRSAPATGERLSTRLLRARG